LLYLLERCMHRSFFLIHTMNTLQTILIAIIEGITEFLPISSTAHMKFANPFLGIADSPFVDLYEIVIQFAAILSVVVIYRKDFFNFKDYRFYLKLLLAVLPALIFGALLKKYIDAVLDNLWVIATVMVLGGIALIFIDRYFKKQVASVDNQPIQFKQAFWVGCFQVLAIVFPGLSRSAATIIGGLSQKLSKKAAAEFSFFLAVPTMLAASAKSTLDVYQDHPEVFVSDNLINLCIGGLVAFVVALVSVKFFIQFVQKRGFSLFGWYRIALGLAMMVWLYLQKA
jgi:undecaprenyl-diphosphatase